MMLAFVRRRVTQSLPTLLGILILVFLMLRLLPGDPAVFMAGPNASPAALAAIRDHLGLADPLWMQFFIYLGGLAHGDLGVSVVNGVPVMQMVAGALPITITVGGLALLISFAIAVPLGTAAAYLASRGRSALDHGLTSLALVVDTIPGFWLALLLMLFFTLRLGLFPSTGPFDPHDPVGLARRLALPVLVLAVGQVAAVARITRMAVLQVLQDDYIRTARALGTPEWEVLFGHALRNAALPIVTVAGLSFGRLLGGTVLIENIFALPGIGTVMLSAITARDYPVVQGMVLLYTLMFVVVNILTDLAYTWVDPRVQL